MFILKKHDFLKPGTIPKFVLFQANYGQCLFTGTLQQRFPIFYVPGSHSMFFFFNHIFTYIFPLTSGAIPKTKHSNTWWPMFIPRVFCRKIYPIFTLQKATSCSFWKIMFFCTCSLWRLGRFQIIFCSNKLLLMFIPRVLCRKNYPIFTLKKNHEFSKWTWCGFLKRRKSVVFAAEYPWNKH